MQRYDIINKLIQKYNFKSYLEVGTERKCQNFDHIQCERKWSVDIDPNSDADSIMSSDEYFDKHKEKFDIIFIDGLHLYEQVLKDIINSLHHLNPGGVIVMHDCLPTREEYQYRDRVTGSWNGDVWKAYYLYKQISQYDCYVIDSDQGCAVIDTNRKKKVKKSDPVNIEMLDWKFFCENKDTKFNIKQDVQ